MLAPYSQLKAIFVESKPFDQQETRLWNIPGCWQRRVNIEPGVMRENRLIDVLKVVV